VSPPAATTVGSLWRVSPVFRSSPYLAYAGSHPGPDRDGLRDELLEYNRDDLVGLVAAAEGFRRLAPPLPAPPIAPAA